MVAEERTAIARGYLEFNSCLGTSHTCLFSLHTTNHCQVYVGLISYGIGNSTLAISSWRLSFIVLGGISFIFSILMFFLFPDRPEEGKFLSAKEAYIAVHRKLDDNTGIENKVGVILTQLKTKY